jgi:hypothetical protein
MDARNSSGASAWDEQRGTPASVPHEVVVLPNPRHLWPIDRVVNELRTTGVSHQRGDAEDWYDGQVVTET